MRRCCWRYSGGVCLVGNLRCYEVARLAMIGSLQLARCKVTRASIYGPVGPIREKSYFRPRSRFTTPPDANDVLCW